MAQTIYYKGVTHRPDNYLCDDGELSLSVNMVNNNGNLQPLEKPLLLAALPTNTRAIYMHEPSGRKYVIAYGVDDNALYAFDTTLIKDAEFDAGEALTIIPAGGLASEPSVTSIGNTLIITSASEPIKYAIWQDGSYKVLSSHPPFVPIQFMLSNDKEVREYFTTSEFSFEYIGVIGNGSIENGDLNSFSLLPEEISRQYITNEVLAVVNKAIADYSTGDTYGRFIFPFFVRYAFRFYDGTLSQHSYPVLMIPNSHILAELSTFAVSFSTGSATAHAGTGFVKFNAPHLYRYIKEVPDGLSEWKDLIQGIDIYISAPIYTYDQSGYIKGWVHSTQSAIKAQSSLSAVNPPLRSSTGAVTESFYTPEYQLILPTKDDDVINEAVTSCSLFYKVASIPFDDIKIPDSVDASNYYGWFGVPVKSEVLSSLTSREVMTDDFNSHHDILASAAMVYNSRLNIAGITERIIADVPLDCQFAYLNDPQKRCRNGVILNVNNESHKLINNNSGLFNSLPRYMFFPHTGATQITFVHDSDNYVMPLKEHTGLNGACYFSGFGENDIPATGASISTGYKEEILVPYPNKLYTSDTDNPFTFNVLNRNIVGAGKILALSSTTKALSEGQFGQFPLYVFTSEGIWALEVNPSGGWNTVQPVARDILLDGTSPLNIDSAIIFLSAKGVMLLQGSSTTCISDRLMQTDIPEIDTSILSAVGISQDTFEVFPATGNLAYDYAHSRVYLFSTRAAWVYSIRTGLWSQCITEGESVRMLNSYPEALLAVSSRDHLGKEVQSLYTLSDDCDYYDNGLVLTRPLKFSSEYLRTVYNVITRGNIEHSDHAVSSVGTVLYASPDMSDFAPIASSTNENIRRVAGTPYRSHRLLLYIHDASQATTIARTSFTVAERYSLKLR